MYRWHFGSQKQETIKEIGSNVLSRVLLEKDQKYDMKFKTQSRMNIIILDSLSIQLNGINKLIFYHRIYRTVASNLILIPSTSAGLRPLSPGRQVLARYPETTTFYNAQVISTKASTFFLYLFPEKSREMEHVNCDLKEKSEKKQK